MSKRHLILASAVLSMSALVASCGGGGGGGTPPQQQTPTPPAPPSPPSPPAPQPPGTPSLGNVVSFVRLTPVGPGQDKYFFVDQSGTKVEVSGLAGKDVTHVLYQFDNLNLLVMTSTNDIYCLDVSKTAATDLKLKFTSHAFGIATRELVNNRPYIVLNTTDGAHVITKDCTPKRITDRNLTVAIAKDFHDQGVTALNNTYGIFQDDAISPSLFVVRSDGTSEKVLNSGQTPVVRIDNSANRPEDSYTTFLVGDENKALPIKFIDDKGTPTQVIVSPLNNYGDKTRIQRVGNEYYIALVNNAGTAVEGYKVAAGSVFRFAANTATLNCTTNATFTVQDFDFDANGNLFVGGLVGGAAGATCIGPNVALNKHLIAVYETGNNIYTAVAQDGTNQKAEILLIRGVQTGALVILNDPANTLGVNAAPVRQGFYFSLNPVPHVRGVDGTTPTRVVGIAVGDATQVNQTCAGNNNVKSGNIVDAIGDVLAAAFAPVNPAHTISIKNTRTGRLIFGVPALSGTNLHGFDFFNKAGVPGAAGVDGILDTFIAALDLAPTAPNPTVGCTVQGRSDSPNKDYFSMNLNRNVPDAIVMVEDAFAGAATNSLVHYTLSGPPAKKLNVVEQQFNDKVNFSQRFATAPTALPVTVNPQDTNCGVNVSVVQSYGFTSRVCVNDPAPPLVVTYVDYMMDSSNKLINLASGLGIAGPTFGDVGNKSPSLFSYVDSAANRGFVSFCPSANTWEYLILGNFSVQYPAGNQQIGFCFRVFNSFDGAGLVGANNALSVPFVR